MSNTVDERVVEMRFDNRQFEKNAEVTMKTLDELKKSLKLEDATKGFESIEKASSKVDMSTLGTNVQRVADRFSVLGIAADQVIRNITNQVTGLVGQFTALIKSMSTDQITAGYKKYDEKVEAVQQIISATGHDIDYVNERLEKLMWFSDETSYSFTDMASNIGKFTSAGVDLDTATTAMMGIANWAAISGANVQTASRAMYNLSQALGMGKMTTLDWKSIENANMATKEFKEEAIKTGLALKTLKKIGDKVYTTNGKVEVTAENMRNTLSEGWFDDKVMMGVLSKYGAYTEAVYENADAFDTCAEAMKHTSEEGMELGAKAFKAAQQARTWKDVVEATKDAVSSSWMSIFENIFGNFEQARELWTDVVNDFYEIFVAGLNKTAESIKNVFTKSQSWRDFEDRIEETGLTLEDFENALKESGPELAADHLIEKYGSLAEALKAGDHYAQILAERGIKKLASSMTTSTKKTVDLEEKLVEIQDIADKVLRGEFGNGEERKKRLEELGYDYDYIQEMAGKSHQGHRLVIEDVKIFDKEIEEVTELTDEQKAALKELADGAEDADGSFKKLLDTLADKNGRELFAESLGNILSYIIQIKEIAGEAFDNVFGDSKERERKLYNLLEHFHDFTARLALTEHAADNLKKSLSGLLSIFKFFGTTAGYLFQIISPLFSIFRDAGSGIGDLSGNVGEAITNFVKWYSTSEEVQEKVDMLRGYVETFSSAISEYLGPVLDKINEKIPKTREELNKLIEEFKQTQVGQILGKVKGKIEELWNKILQYDYTKITNAVNKVINALKAAWRIIKKVYGSIKSFLTPYISQAGTALSGFISRIWELVKGWGAWLENLSENEGIIPFIVRKITELKDTVVEFVRSGGLQRIFNGFTEKLDPIKKRVEKFVDDISENLKDVDWSKVLAFTLGLSMVPVLLTLASMFKEASQLFKYSRTLIGNINSLVWKIKQGMKSTVIEIAKATVLFATAIAILAGSLWLIAQIPSDKLKDAGIALGILAGGLAVLTVVIGLLSPKMAGFNSIALGMLAFAGSIAILVASIWGLQQIEKVNWDAVGALALLLGVMIAGLAVFHTLEPKYTSALAGTGIAFVSFAAAVYILAASLEKVSRIKGKNLTQSFEALAALMLMLTALGIAARFTKGVGLGLIGASVSLLLILKFSEKLADYKVKRNVEKAMSNWQLLLKLFGAMAAMAIVSRIASGKGLGLSILALSASLLIIFEAVKKFASLDTKVLDKGLSAIGIVIFLISIFGAISTLSLTNPAKMATVVIALSVSLLIIYQAMKWMGNLDDDKYVKGLFSIIVILGLFAGIAAIIGHMKGGVKAGPILAMALAIGVLAGAMALLTLYSWDKLMWSAVSLGVVLLGFGRALDYASDAQFDGKTIAAFLLGLVALGGIAFILNKIAKNNWKGLAASAGGITACILSLSATMKIISSIPGSSLNISQLIAFAAGIIGMYFIGQILKSVADLPWQNMLSAAGSISLVLIATAAAIAIMGLVGAKGVGAGLLGIAGIAVIFAGIGALAHWIGENATDKTFENLDKGIRVFGKVGEVIGSVVGGYQEGQASHMPAIGEYLSEFADNSKGFFDSIGSLNPDGPKVLSELFDSLAGVVSGSNWEKIINWITGDSTSALDLLPAQMTTIGAAFRTLAYGLPDEEGTAKIASLGPMIQGFVDLSNQMSYTDDSWMGKIFGREDLGDFGTHLKQFGEALTEYSTTVEGLQVDKIQASVPAAEAVGQIADTIPTEGGLISVFTGNTAWDTIKNNLRGFGLTMSTYGLLVSNLKVDKIQASVPAAEALGAIGEALPTTGGVAHWFSGEIAWEDLRSNLASFGIAMRTFSLIAAGIDANAIKQSVEPAKAIAEIADALPEATKKGILTSSSGAIDSFRANLRVYGSAIVDYSNILADANYMAIERVPELAKGGENVGQAIADGLATKHNEIRSAINALFSTAASAARGQIAVFRVLGENVASGISVGIYTGAHWAYEAISELARRMKEEFKKDINSNSPSKVFAEIGEYIPMGVGKGVNDGISYATDSVDNMADMMVTAMSPAMAILSDLMNSDMEFDPTIRPVLDMSDVNSQAGSIASLFAGQSVGVRLGASVSGSVNDYQTYTASKNANYTSDLDHLISLNEQLIEIAKTGGDVYLDSNVIAGSVNSKLGLL